MQSKAIAIRNKPDIDWAEGLRFMVVDAIINIAGKCMYSYAHAMVFSSVLSFFYTCSCSATPMYQKIAYATEYQVARWGKF